MKVKIIAAQPHVLMSLPVGALADAGIGPDDVIEIYVEDKKVVLQKAELDGAIVCDEDCDHCPLRLLECENEDSREAIVKG